MYIIFTDDTNLNISKKSSHLWKILITYLLILIKLIASHLNIIYLNINIENKLLIQVLHTEFIGTNMI